jgi:hypothetical protein
LSLPSLYEVGNLARAEPAQPAVSSAQ